MNKPAGLWGFLQGVERTWDGVSKPVSKTVLFELVHSEKTRVDIALKLEQMTGTKLNIVESIDSAWHRLKKELLALGAEFNPQPPFEIFIQEQIAVLQKETKKKIARGTINKIENAKLADLRIGIRNETLSKAVTKNPGPLTIIIPESSAMYGKGPESTQRKPLHPGKKVYLTIGASKPKR